MTRSERKPLANRGGTKGLDDYLGYVPETWASPWSEDQWGSPVESPASHVLFLSTLLNRRLKRENQAHLGISMSAVRLLICLHRYGPSTLKQLIEITSMDKALVSRAMATMVRSGYIGFSGPLERPTRFTARTKAVLAAEGEELLKRALVVSRPLHLEVVQALTPSERRILHKILRRLIILAEGWETAAVNAPRAYASPKRPVSKRRPADTARRRVGTRKSKAV